MLSKLLGGLGRSLMTAGTLILLFVAYQLWGTGIQEARSQQQLGNEFEQVLARADQNGATTTTTTTPATTTTVDPIDTEHPNIEKMDPVPAIDGWLPAYGEPVAEISIPAIGVNRTVVEGETVEQLKRGVGHNPASPLPGQQGNVAMSGHRTTYGQPFHNVDKLKTGDLIEFKTIQGEFAYAVDDIFIVKPNDTHILDDKGDNRITLVACHPKYSLKERIIVTGQLVGKPVAPIEGQDTVRKEAAQNTDLTSLGEAASLSGQSQARTPAVLWFLACAFIWLATWLVQTLLRKRMKRAAHIDTRTPSRGERLLTWTPYLVGVPVFLVALYFFFENFSLLLPGNY